MGKIAVIGIGPGAPGYVLPCAREAIAGADVLIGAGRHLASFAGEGKRLVFMEEGMDAAFSVAESESETRRVAFLLSGDPCFYSLLGKIASRFPPGSIEVIPGVSSFQLLFARLGIQWNDAVVGSLHGRPLEGVLGLVREQGMTVLFTDPENSGRAISRFLKGRGFPDRPAWLAERLGYPDERLLETSLHALADFREEGPLSLLLLGKGPLPPAEKGVLPDGWFHRAEGVPLSKEPVRALAASLLFPLEGLSVLEIGAGSGGITTELARRVGTGTVFAVEKEEAALAASGSNLGRAGVGHRVRLISGTAPEALRGLPSFHRVVVGGHGGSVEAVIEGAWQKLLPGGRILVAANMPSSADRAWRKLKELGAVPFLLHVNASSARETGDSWMLISANPAFILWADKGGQSRGDL